MLMRAMGPGSVSSLLKTALDVVYYVLFAGAVALLVSAGLALVLPFQNNLVATLPDGAQVALTRTLLATVLAVTSVYCGLLVIVLGRLRRVFTTLTAGDPFHPANIHRLRAIGVGLAALEALNILVRVMIPLWIPGAVRGIGFDLTAWFSVLVVFVLAEVFREGARLRREAELTI
jgi:hypothetical protein